MTWLGVDLGNARVGLALSDPEETMAHPAGNIQAYGDYLMTVDDVLDVIEDEHVTRVVVGLPLELDGREGPSARKARRWTSELIHALGDEVRDPASGINVMPDVTLLDERLTTVDSHRMLFDANVDSRKHRAMIDQQSAVVILQTALDSARQNEEQ
ncbi:Holliday junction resolvase RuvX [Bifidobacterium choloepi]|uniref:Putative pre-16S rRNA nuclease n=1 Tax=Bifidobacterium choloepi TaxID=2614131 RepID=A0A6I5NCS1_9BIFI|nr:Holliday junction resolvase RuvX [Bifidobacterium choloepi]NEG69264.1 Holliday junction resolvase RuvX [Bifidobacterium choloepi]